MGIFGTKRSHGARAVVTGAGSGIGAAFAAELHRRGGQILCSDIDEDAAHATARAITELGGRATAVRCDVSGISDVERLAEKAQTWFDGPPTLVINNAGVGAGGQPIGEVPLDDWHWVLDVNLWGPIHGCHVFTPLLRDAGYGGVINVASAAAFGAAPEWPPITSARQGCSRCRRRWRPNCRAAASMLRCYARRSSKLTSSNPAGYQHNPPTARSG